MKRRYLKTPGNSLYIGWFEAGPVDPTGLSHCCLYPGGEHVVSLYELSPFMSLLFFIEVYSNHANFIMSSNWWVPEINTSPPIIQRVSNNKKRKRAFKLITKENLNNMSQKLLQNKPGEFAL